MKKISLLILLLLSVSLFLASCGGKKTDETTAGGTEPGTAPQSDIVTDPATVPDGLFIPAEGKVAVLYSNNDGYRVASDIFMFLHALGVDTKNITLGKSGDGEYALTVYVGSYAGVAVSDAVAEASGALEAGDLGYFVSAQGNKIGILCTGTVLEDRLAEGLAAYFTKVSNGFYLTENFDFSYIYTKAQQEADAIAEAERIAREKEEADRRFREQADLEWETRFDRVTDPELKTAIKALYDFYDPDAQIEWWGSLYEPEIGGFYYAVSSRDTNGFLPDMESTYQVLARVKTSTLIGNHSTLREFLGEELSEKIIQFYQKMQDPNTGYFFHPQFPQSISALNTMRYTRDMDWAIDVLHWLGSAPLYPTALDRMKNSASILTGDALLSTGLPKGAQLSESWEANRDSIRAYMDTLFRTASCESWANTLQTQLSSFEAAGVIDDVLDYLDEKINPEYGIWVTDYDPVKNRYRNLKATPESETPYGIATMTYKIIAMYDDVDRVFPGRIGAARAAVNAILGGETTIRSTYLYNPWATLSKIRENLAIDNNPADIAEMNALMAENGVAMVNMLISMLGTYKWADGSFSFLPTGSSPDIYGTVVSLGHKEGDVNGNNLMLNISSHVCIALGFNTIPIFNYKHGEKLVEIMKNATVYPKKKELPNGSTFDFESTEPGKLPIGTTQPGTGEGTSFGAITDPTNPRNNVLQILKDTQAQTNGGSVQFTMANATVYDNDVAIRIGFKLYVSKETTFGSEVTSKTNKAIAQIRLYTGTTTLFMPTLYFNSDTPSGFQFGVGKSTTGGYSKVAKTPLFRFDTWYDVEIQLHYNNAGKTDASLDATITVDGNTVMESHCFYSDADTSTETSGTLKITGEQLGFRLQPMARAHVRMYLDDLSASFVEYVAPVGE